MRALTNSEIIEMWESAHSLHPIDRGLILLQKVLAPQPRDELAALPLGSRDALLLALRRSTFGDLLVCRSDCPHCGEVMELECSCTALLTDMEVPRQKTILQEDYAVTLRPLDSFDLAAAASENSLGDAQNQLVKRCVAQASYKDKPIPAEELPPNILLAITETASSVDPYAEILLDLSCSDCGNHSHNVLDIGHILWREITSRARRLLMEVHQLAKAYGWAEAEILQLSAPRRSAYLQMVTA